MFGYPWRYPFVIFEPGPRRSDLGSVWRQNGQALAGGNRWGQQWGAAAIEHQADEIERGGERFDFSRVALGLEVGASTRPDNAAYLRETFGDRAAECYQAALDAVAGNGIGRPEPGAIARWLRLAAAAERSAGQVFLRQSGLTSNN